jgi:SNF2 family DNA or RNA helicase
MSKLLDHAKPPRSGWSLAGDQLAFATDVCIAIRSGELSPQIMPGKDDGRPSTHSIDLTITPDGTFAASFAARSPETMGCVFPEARLQTPRTESRRREPPTAATSSQTSPAPRPIAKSATRIRPPRDIVKLEDRLRFLLQPPLESQLSAESLRFAHRPFPYQLDGIAFLYPRHHAVLADEMGLGKTMQAITAVRLLAHHGYLRRALLVCPKPLVTNWQREFALWAPELPLTVVDGPAARRQFLWKNSDDVVTIANYESVVRDSADVCDAANVFDLVILDEAQRIKNRANVTNQIARSIPRARSWALTGTPIENSVEDLVGIFEFVAPGQVDSEMKPRAVGRAVSDFVLRRTKELVLTDLPPKLFRDADLELTPEQAASYQLAEEEGIIRLREMKHEITIQHVFELVLRLKQICNFDPATGASSKMERLEADLEECAASGRKAIVFSQWVETIAELRKRLERFAPAEFHGQIPGRRRDAVLEHFRNASDCHVLLMTYGAGSVVLNLQFANYVFLFDRWWNPAVEDQAINRAHRIGATSPVTVTRFLTLGTIEERINQILEQKRELFDTVFGESLKAPKSGLTREEVFSLFDLRPSGETAAA